MVKVEDRVFISADKECRLGTEQLAVVHACKSPCHQQAVGYRGNLPNSHPNYLVLRKEHDLYLNIIDPPVPLFKTETFKQFLAFARVKYNTGASLLIHCNQGESRAPSLALLFLAKHLGTIANSSYTDAAQAFVGIFPSYRPGVGIQRFLSDQWTAIR